MPYQRNIMDIWNEALNRAATTMEPFLTAQAEPMPWDQVDIAPDSESPFSSGGAPADPWLAALMKTRTSGGRDLLDNINPGRRARTAPTTQTGQTPAIAKPAETNTRIAVTAMSQVGNPTESQMLEAGSKYLGRPYVWGGGRGGNTENFDCSSFVSRVVQDATGKKLTAFTDSIYNETAAVDPKEARVGDIVLFEWNDPSQPGVRFSHTGIYAGNGRILNATSPGGVQYSDMSIFAGRPIFRRVR